MICTTGVGNKGEFSCLMSERVPDLNLLAAGVQAFPRWTYRRVEATEAG